jgi:hypothetical protein
MAEIIIVQATENTETITFEATESGESITVYLNEQARGPAGTGGGGTADVAESINDATAKTTPVDADRFTLTDSAASYALRKVTWANIKATLKAYLDTLYAAISHTHTSSDIISVNSGTIIGRHGSGVGAAQEIGIDGGLEINGGNLRRSAVTGPVTIAAGGSESDIDDDALTISMTNGLQTILDGSEGGNGAADAGKLAKFSADGYLAAARFSSYSGGVEGTVIEQTAIGIWSGTARTFLETDATDSRYVTFKDEDGTVAFMDDVDKKLTTDPTGITGADALTNIVSLTQAEYNDIVSKSATTLYIIT